ncbi:MAG TPA: glycosyltransferase family 2 protein [Xanthomonadaceae bacterium]|nr:glycosyltransferase family 2 protein [Xanthomonadaceae bacterium]
MRVQLISKSTPQSLLDDTSTLDQPMPKSTERRKGSPLVTVCIANYNGEMILADCVDSLLNQAGAIDMEIIIHDDASTDTSVDLIREKYPQVKLITSHENVGFCIANNRMVATAKGEFILLLNNDAALFSDAISSLVEFATKEDGKGILTLPQYDWESEELVDRGSVLDPFLNAVPNRSRDYHSVAYVIGACLWTPKSLWEQIGGFPPWLESIGEDIFLCLAARLAGFPVMVVPASGYRHRQGHSFGGNRIGDRIRTTYRRRGLSERNRLCVLLCCTPGWWVVPWTILHITVIALEGLALCVWMRSLRPWRDIYGMALRECWSKRHLVRDVRRHVQSLRRIGLREYLRGFRPIPRKVQLLLRHGAPHLHD